MEETIAAVEKELKDNVEKIHSLLDRVDAEINKINHRIKFEECFEECTEGNPKLCMILSLLREVSYDLQKILESIHNFWEFKECEYYKFPSYLRV